ncbi:hypothetical protein [Streptomyces sp. NPDC051546]|uniref:hypothetical protein n=1 Tax=Streptomyces sp. NPDC051546 TaxID=3365655 RepID=UPI00379BB95C
MRIGKTYTPHFEVETRQHEIVGFDLGEGIPRRALIMWLVLTLVWSGGLVLILGAPSKITFTIYFLPPLLTVVYGVQRSRRTDRRWNITNWSVAIRYLALGHRPIINGGRRASTRSEYIGRRGRWGPRVAVLTESAALGGAVEKWLGPDEVPAGAGPALSLAARPRLYGPDAVAKAHGRKATARRKGDA